MIRIEENFLKLIPKLPGVYKYFDESKRIIYIGKAKNLHSRVSSYFGHKEDLSPKTRVLVSKIVWMDYILVNNEGEAFLLENNLIKENQPKYNILLKDDKTYPWVVITKEPYPRVFITRRFNKNFGEYFGPFTSKHNIDYMLNAIHRIVPYRTCKLALSKDKIDEGLFSVCLEYHIHNCKAPCVGKQTQSVYNESIDQIRHILKGETKILRKRITEEIETCCEKLEFEKADALNKRLEYLKEYESKQIIANPSFGNFDVITITEWKNRISTNYMQIRNGFVTLSINREIKNPLEEDYSNMLEQTLFKMQTNFNSLASLIVTNVENGSIPGKRIECPQRGEKKKLVDLSIINCRELIEQSTCRRCADHSATLKNLQTILNLKVTPIRIECIDNSNMMGQNAVSACVVFVDGKPAKSEYRIYNVKTVQGPNDYATMREVITRRYGKMELTQLPNLLILDGGKGQLHIGVETLKELNLIDKLPIVALAEKLEEIYLPNDPYPIYLDKRSDELKLMQSLRDEAHRFGITHYRKKHQKETEHSVLSELDGIGKETIKTIYRAYGSLENVKREGLDPLIKLVGSKKASIVWNFLEGMATSHE
jgi:excinuclease ABC, C subunit